MHTQSKLPYFVLCALLVFTLSAPAVAQTATATVLGTVRDATGAVIPGVEITLTSLATGAERFAVTDDEGRFRITNVAPGDYEASAQLTGFKTATATFELDVTERQTLNFSMEVGEISEIVEVEGAVQRINTEEGSLSNVVTQKQIDDLPLNGRNIFQLATLQPGIVVSPNDGINPDGVGGFSSAGLRSRGNNFSLDGVSNNDPITGGAVSLTPALDTVEEFRVQNNNFSAEFGRNNGAVVQVITKSGGNDFHGAVSWFHRNDALDAREIFDTEDLAPLRQHQGGFAVSGPIVKDKTFFLFGFGGVHTFSGESSLFQVETPEFRQLVQQQFPGTTPAFFLENFPAPTPTGDVEDIGSPSTGIFSPGPLDGIPDKGEVSSFAPDLFKSYQYNIRIDHELTDSNKLFGRYIWEDQESPASNIRAPELGFNFEGLDAHGVISDTHIFNPTVVNEFRFGYSRDTSNFLTDRNDIGDFDIFNTPAGHGLFGFGAYAGIPQTFTGEEYQLVDVVSINAGDHGIKTGFEYRWNQDDSNFGFLQNGFVGYLGLFDFAANLPYYVAARVDPRQVGGVPELVGTPHNFRQQEWGFFIQDDWKVTDRLTLNLGLRYDNYGLIDDTQGRLANIILGSGVDIFERVMNSVVGQVEPEGIFAEDNNNFSPRLGFAWDLFGDGRTSLRGGFGVGYDRLFLNVSGNVRFNPPFSANLGLLPFQLFGQLGVSPTEVAQFISTGATVPFQVPLGITSAGFNPGGGPLLDFTLPNGNTVQLGGRITLRAPDPSLRTSYSMNWFLGIQRELPWDMLFEANYVGNGGRKLGFIDQYNRFNGDRFGLANPYDGSNEGDTAINFLSPWFSSENLRTNNVNSIYHGGNVSVNKRFSEGLSFQSAFTFGKVLDYGSDNFDNSAGSIFSPNPARLDLERGRAAFDVRKRWVSNFIWEIPFLRDQQGVAGQVFGGWQVQGILTFQDGTPYTPQAFSSAWDLNGDGRNNDRLDGPAGRFDELNDNDKQDYLTGVFGPDRDTAQAVFLPTGIPGDCDGDGALGGPTGVATLNGVSCIGIGTLGRSNFVGPGFNNVDFSLFKNFAIPWFTQEDARLQFRAEFFNFFNRVNLGQVNRNFVSSFFGRVTAANDAREMQFGLRFMF